MSATARSHVGSWLTGRVGASCAPARRGPSFRTPLGLTLVADVDARDDELKQVNRAIWQFAEVGLQEFKSSRLLVEKLQDAGFEVETGLSGMPTAFVATK